MDFAWPSGPDGIGQKEISLHLAIALFVDNKVTLGQGARLAGLSQPFFLQELGKRKIPIHYGIMELEQDIAAVQKLMGGTE